MRISESNIKNVSNMRNICGNNTEKCEYTEVGFVSRVSLLRRICIPRGTKNIALLCRCAIVFVRALLPFHPSVQLPPLRFYKKVGKAYLSFKIAIKIRHKVWVECIRIFRKFLGLLDLLLNIKSNQYFCILHFLYYLLLYLFTLIVYI